MRVRATPVPATLPFVLCLALGLAACAAGPRQDQSGAAGPGSQPPADAWPPFPGGAPVAGPRQGSLLINSVLSSEQVSTLGPGAMLRGDLPGNPLELSAGELASSWALFDFNGIGASVSGLELTVLQTDEDGAPVAAQPLWLGWADYSTQRWSWTLLPGNPDGDSLSLGSGIEAVSPLQQVHIAVLAFDDAHVLISALELERDCLPAVQNFQAVGTSSEVTLSWDEVLDAEGYRLYYADTSAPLPSYQPLIEFDDPSVTQFVHSGVFPVGKEAAYGVRYSYGIEVILTDSVVLSCEHPEASRILATPQNARASDHLHSEAIRIRWDAVDDATSYRIYRDGDEPEIAEVPAGMYFYQDEDPVVWLATDHFYTVSAVGIEGESARSAPAAGRTANYSSFTVDSSADLADTGPEVVLLNGGPAVAGFTYVDENPFVSISTDTLPMAPADFAGHLVDNTADGIGKTRGLAVIDGRLAQAMNYKGGDGMRYARALVELPTATSDWELTIIDSANNGNYPCMASLAGLPACAYTDDADALVFAWTGDGSPGGPDDWTRIVLDATGSTTSPHLMDAGGLAALCYRRAYDEMMTAVNDLHYVRATVSSPDGPEDFVGFAVDTAAEVRDESALLNLGGLPVIAYTDESGPAPLIKLAIGLTAEPSSAADFELRTIYTSTSLGADIVDLNLALCDKGMLLSFTEYLGASNYQLQVLRSNYMPPEDELDSMLETFQTNSEPAGGPGSSVFALGNGAAALFYGEWVGADMRCELIYAYDTP